VISTAGLFSQTGIEARGPMRTTKKLSGIELSDWQGERVRLEVLWKERPVVLVFIRHFG
jgi:hypothetical protein